MKPVLVTECAIRCLQFSADERVARGEAKILHIAHTERRCNKAHNIDSMRAVKTKIKGSGLN
jgi:hypothetical protein